MEISDDEEKPLLRDAETDDSRRLTTKLHQNVPEKRSIKRKCRQNRPQSVCPGKPEVHLSINLCIPCLESAVTDFHVSNFQNIHSSSLVGFSVADVQTAGIRGLPCLECTSNVDCAIARPIQRWCTWKMWTNCVCLTKINFLTILFSPTNARAIVAIAPKHTWWLLMYGESIRRESS